MRNDNSKIQIPNVDKGYTKRAADDLLASLRTDIVLLNAGAGYGKTQILANYVRQFPKKSAWYSVSSTDNDLMSFIQNFTRSVQHAVGNFKEDFTASVPLLEQIDIVMEQLVIWLDARIDFLNIILDDFQEITNPDIFNLLDIILETMEQKIRLFIVEKRSLPPFFDKYTASGRATCIGTDDLKFKQEEIAILVENTGENSEQWAKLIYDCTEGWPVGIAQILLQLQQHKMGVTTEILKDICDKLEVSDYFMTRVYKMLPFDIQTFLKKTAVLDYMTPSICNTVTKIHNSESMLRYLVNEKLFVQTLGEVDFLYRYHSIFQRFLLTQTTLEEQQESLLAAAYFLLKTADKIQAADYACRGTAPNIVLAVIEVSGDSMLEERLYGTLERWFSFLETNHCELTPKARFVYGKYLMALGHKKEAVRQIETAGKAFYEEGRMIDYKKILLFVAAASRNAGQLERAQTYLGKASQNLEPDWNEITKANCTEQVKLYISLHQLEDAFLLLSTKAKQGASFPRDSFLYAAHKTLEVLIHTKEVPTRSLGILLESIPEGFLLQNCIFAEQMKSAYLCADYETAKQAAKGLLQSSQHETAQTAAAWELLAVLSWDEGNYRKAVEQSRMGSLFLRENKSWNPGLTPKHLQILEEIHSIHKASTNAPYLASHAQNCAISDPKGARKIKILCMNCFCVFLPGQEEQELKWRTKKAKELFAYLFHLQGNSISRESLIELLWPDSGTKSAIALFHTTLYSIRQSFVQEGLEDLIAYEKKKYSLNMQLVESDLEELILYFKDPAACENSSERIMQLYQGSYMGSTGYIWSYGMAKELENYYLEFLKSGASKRMEQNQIASAIPFFQRILDADPYNEEIISQLVACFYKSGKQSKAKQLYDRMQKLYREDLELDFSKTFREIIEE